MNGCENTIILELVCCWKDRNLLLARWQRDSKDVIKGAYAQILQDIRLKLSGFCMNVKGRGGTRGAVRCIYSQLLNYSFAARFDVKHYYTSINHKVLIMTAENFGINKKFLSIINQYLKLPCFGKAEKGLIAGGSLSPLLGAVYLSSLDRSMLKLRNKGQIFYVRYQDDIVILAKKRWHLKNAIKIMYSVLDELKLKIHRKQKIFIGRIEKGFSFLGYYFKPGCKLRPSEETVKRLASNSLRLYEQGGDISRLRRYLSKWLTYFKGGLNYETKNLQLNYIEKFIEYKFKKLNIYLSYLK